MKQQTLLRIVAIGAIAGMRTMTAPALVAAYLGQQSVRVTKGSPLQWLGTKEAGTVLALLAAGELAVDKVPNIPARIKPGPLFGRAASGAVSGAALSEAEGEPAASGAVLGAATAVLSAFAMYHLRRAGSEVLGLPDPLLAVMEDALALRGGSGVLGIASPVQPRNFL